MNTQDDINAQEIAKLIQDISKMTEGQQIEARVRFLIGERITVEMVMKDNKQPNSKEEQK